MHLPFLWTGFLLYAIDCTRRNINHQQRFIISMSEPNNTEKCIPCESLDPSFLLSREQIQERITTTIPLWTLLNNEQNMLTLQRSFVAKNFQAALECLNAMGAVAEAMAHHPDLHLTNYRELRVVIYTHKLNGVTDNDVVLARALDERVKINYSPKWLKEHPEASATSRQ